MWLTDSEGMLILPLEMVQQHSLCEMQKAQAMAYLDQLGWKTGKEEPWT